MGFVFFRSKRVIGLDIGSSSIKITELEMGRQTAKVLSFGSMPTAVTQFNNGEIQDQDSLGVAIRQVLMDHKIKTKSAAVGLSGTSAIVKKITIPRIDRKLLADQVRFEAEQYIPFDLNSISLAHHVIESTSTPESMDLLLVAAQNEVVNAYTNLVHAAGLSLAILDVSGFALANIFEFNYGRLPGQTVALLNMGATTTNFVVVHDGDVVFSRDMNVGGQNYTYEIHKELGISLPEAEALKLGAVRGEGVPDEVHSLISSVSETVKEEIRNCFDYFAGTSSSLAIGQCFFTGGGASTPGLMEAISQATSVRFEPLNPLLKMTGSKAVSPDFFPQLAPFATISLGLALRKAGEK